MILAAAAAASVVLLLYPGTHALSHALSHTNTLPLFEFHISESK